MSFARGEGQSVETSHVELFDGVTAAIAVSLDGFAAGPNQHVVHLMLRPSRT